MQEQKCVVPCRNIGYQLQTASFDHKYYIFSYYLVERTRSHNFLVIVFYHTYLRTASQSWSMFVCLYCKYQKLDIRKLILCLATTNHQSYTRNISLERVPKIVLFMYYVRLFIFIILISRILKNCYLY